MTAAMPPTTASAADSAAPARPVGVAERTPRRRWRPWVAFAAALVALRSATLLVDQPGAAVVGLLVAITALVLTARGTRTVGGRAAQDLPAPPPPPDLPQVERSTTTGHVVALIATTAAVLVALFVRSQVIAGLVFAAALFIPLERLVPLRREQRIRRRQWGSDVVHFLVNNILSTVMGLALALAAIVVLRRWIDPGFQDWISSLPLLAQFAIAVLVVDLVSYGMHRAFHEIPWMWRFHAVHHSITEMDWLASARLHPLNQAFDRAAIAVPLVLFGFSRATFGAYLVFTAFMALFIHANVRLTFGPLRWLIATPEFHHWHHGDEPAAVNTNFSAQFPWVDALFGTLRLPHRWPVAYGIREPMPDSWARQMAWPVQDHA